MLPPASTRFRWIAASAFLALTYFGAARLGLLLATVHGNVSPVWPAAGVALGALLLGGIRLWPGVLLGAFAANALTSVSLGVALAIAIGNTLEAVAGAGLANWIARRLKRLELDTLGDAAALVTASIAAPLIAATGGVLALRAGDAEVQRSFAALWRTWWVGDALGALIVAPLLLAGAEAFKGGVTRNWRYVAKTTMLLGAGAVLAWTIFYRPGGGSFVFAIFPVMLLAAAWLDSWGVKLTALMISAVGISAAFAGSGPFASGAVNQDLLHLQLFLSSVAIAALVLPVFRAAGSLLMAGGVLLAMWLVSGWLFASLQEDRWRADAARLDVMVSEAEAGIRQRLATYEDALRGGVGLLTTAERVSRAQWRTYAQSVNVSGRYPGVLGIGVIFPVRQPDEAAFLAATRADGEPNFGIREVPLPSANKPSSESRERYVITYLEPMVGNLKAIGLDIASEVNRRTAAEQSRDAAEARMTARITLVQDHRRRAGFLLLTPIYRPGSPLDTVAQRREALVAWIYSPFVTEEFFAGVLGGRKEVRVASYAGADVNPENLVYRSPGGKTARETFDRVSRLRLAGQTFTFGWNRGPYFVVAGQSAAVWAATSMALISLLVAGLVMSLDVLARKAQEIAAHRTAELAATSERLKALNAQLEQKSAEFQNFAHTASHDLREPLRGVQGFAELLEDGFKSQMPDEAKRMIQRIRAAAARMSALIDTLLGYAEINAGPADFQAVDLEEVLRAVEHDLHPRIEQVRGRIQQFGRLPVVTGDPTQLRQLFQNLITNALKFHRAGVPPVITVEATRLQAELDGTRWAKIAIADNGVGFAPEHAERIFRPFDRLHGKSEFEGTGLGLAICKRVVERHGGQIAAQGEPGQGAILAFTLRLAAQDGSASPPSPRNAGQTQTRI